MKTLYFFRHSLKDGPGNTIGPKGLKLAQQVGEWLYNSDGSLEFSKLFHGPLLRTAQTALAFLDGFDIIGMQTMPVVAEFGSDEMFAEMVKPSQFRILAATMGNFRALCQCHEPSTVNQWALHCAVGLRKAFDVMDDGEFSVAFGHSPAIELALAGATNSLDLPDDYALLVEMQGIVFEQANDGGIRAVRKIAMPESEMKLA